jgi:POT family proton-dependent oligopeptide transporter
MWERFSFYTMLAMFTLYLRDADDGFGWTAAQATSLYSTYLMFVYASPLVGGLVADWKLGYRRSVMIGGVFFMAGHLLLAFRSVEAVYAALTCLVIGNGFFKPNVSTMVGNLYPEGSHLKDRAYNIFYMGINVGALYAPIVAEAVKSRVGFHPAFAVAAGGMVISVVVLWTFRKLVEDSGKRGAEAPAAPTAMDAVPEWKRISALVVIFIVVIVFWMVFHQNGSTLTYWADENTDWSRSRVLPWVVRILSFGLVARSNFSGVISNAINPFWVVTLTFPLVWVWKAFDRRGLEPSTPTKMAIGMLLTATSFAVLYLAARSGGDAGRVSPYWLVSSYFVVTCGELCLSPMGLSLVSKVAPKRMRGLLMGGWFVATAIGNKLTMIGVYWEEWKHSTFFAVLGASALSMAFVLALLLRPLKRAMPGV